MEKYRGFTLIELMIAIGIVAILVRVAAPSFTRLVQSNAMTSTVNSFLSDLRFARSEAIRRGGGVVMCRSDNPEDATPTCGTGSTTGWESGWIIFHDLNGDAAKGSTESLLRAQGRITAVNTITETGPATKFQFTATGQLRLSSLTTIQFGSNPPFANTAQRVICVSVGGRGRISGDGTASCS
jgi:type IV fimbrial biogenesis protein FimT